MGLKIIITGATGMVGEGVLRVCLEDQRIEKVLSVSRKSCGITHPKLTEIVHTDFLDISPIEAQLAGYDACFFCLGISSVGAKADDYYRTTYTLTLHVAETLSRLNKDLTFCYVAGAGTDSTEKGSLAWARVKGKVENDLQKLPFKKAYGLRPGFIKPYAGQQNALSFYKYINWLFPMGRALSANGFCTMQELARCMITLTEGKFEKTVVTGKDIIELGK